MATVLVVGASGQLGSEVVARLAAAGTHVVRALVRQSAPAFARNVDIFKGDLRDRESLLRACKGVDVVVATATVVFPRGRASFRRDEQEGYANLIDACKREGVKQFVFISLSVPFEARYLAICPTYRMKAWVESLLEQSQMSYTILRCPPFMDDYFALMGSTLPLQGEAAATLDRATGMTRWIRALAGNSIERWGWAVAPGSPNQSHSFIALGDVASYVIASLDNQEARNAVLEIGGPEALTWKQVSTLYATLLDRPVRLLCIPAPLLRLLAFLVYPFSRILSNQVAILWILGQHGTRIDSANIAERFGVHRTDAFSYLQRKLELGKTSS
ncbi:MAG: SDR family oxidoreductase [Lysobacterales bacterium]